MAGLAALGGFTKGEFELVQVARFGCGGQFDRLGAQLVGVLAKLRLLGPDFGLGLGLAPLVGSGSKPCLGQFGHGGDVVQKGGQATSHRSSFRGTGARGVARPA